MNYSIINIFFLNLFYDVFVDLVRATTNDEFSMPNKTRMKRQTGPPQTCVPLSALNGQVNYLQTNPSIPYSSGTTAILACNLGFIISGSPNSICGNSIWSPPLGTCTSASIGLPPFPLGLAPPPPGIGPPSGILQTPGSPGANCFPQIPPMNGQLRYSAGGLFGPFPPGSTVSLACNPGFVPTGGTISTCEFGSWQPPTLGFCNTSGGIGSSGFSVNGVTTVGGTSTNTIANSFSTSPSAFGGGSGPQCLAFPRPVNGQIQYSLIQMGSGYPVGTIATLICNPGLVTNQMSSICGAGGLWNPLIGTCNPLNDVPAGMGNAGERNNGFLSLLSMGSGQCLLGMLPPLGSTINYSQGTGTLGPFPSGTMAMLTCLNGSPVGPRTSSCDSGQWDPPLFHGCDMSQTSVLHTPPSFSPSTPPAGPPPDEPISLAVLAQPSEITTSAADSGDEDSLPDVSPGGLKGAAISTQVIGGSGISPPGAPCLTGMPPVAGGTVMYSQGGSIGPYPTGTIATLQCNGGTSLGLLSSSCLNGAWSPRVIGPCTGGPGGGTALGGLPTTPGAGSVSPFGPLPPGSPLGATPSFGAGNPFNTAAPYGTSALPGSPFGVTPPFGTSNPFNTASPFGTSAFPGSPFGAGTPPSVLGIGNTPGVLGAATPSLGVGGLPGSPGAGIPGSFGAGGIPGAFGANGLTGSMGGVGGLPGSFGAGGLPGMLGGSPSATNPFGATTPFGASNPAGAPGAPFGAFGASQPQCLLGAIPPMNGQITYVPPTSQMASPASTMFMPYPPGTFAQLTCKPGFAPRGQITAVCRNGLFDPPLGQCVLAGGAPPLGSAGISFSAPQNQSFSVMSNSVGGVANNDVLDEFSARAHEQSGCPDIELATAEGGKVTYVLDGNKTDLAFADMSNSNSITTTVLPAASYHNIVPHPIGTVASLSCNNGYVTIGSMVTICEVHGWSMPVLGDCIQPKTRSITSTAPPNVADN